MTTNQLKKISKRMSYVLRHRPDVAGLELAPGGWVIVEDLLAALTREAETVTLELLRLVVAENDKQRFEFSEDGNRIRARQGHSVDVELGYDPADPPAVLYHGTATRNLDSIFDHGLLKGRRQHVHLSTNKETMMQVAQRHGKPILLAVDAARMASDGHVFFVTGNSVWLIDRVPAEYLSIAEE